MQGSVVVVPSTFYSQLAPDGSFQIGGVPAGRYRLVSYSPEAEQLIQPVDVRVRECTVVKLQLVPPGQAQSPGHGQPTVGREKAR